MNWTYNKHLPNPNEEQNNHAMRLLSKFRCTTSKSRFQQNQIYKQGNGYIQEHWSIKIIAIWESRMHSNAKCIVHLKELFHKDIPWIYKQTYLDHRYQFILNKLNYLGDIATSRHYILQLQLQCICESICNTGSKNIKHSEIEEYKNMDVSMDECFCESLDGINPKFCLYCRQRENYDYKCIQLNS